DNSGVRILLLTPFERQFGPSRDVAQPGRALAWGARGRQFKSARPDQTSLCFARFRPHCFESLLRVVFTHGDYSIVSSRCGASPLLRRISRSKATKSARFRRSAKNTAVFMTASFSATAVATN